MFFNFETYKINDPKTHYIQPLVQKLQHKLDELDMLINPDYHQKYLGEYFDSILTDIKHHRLNLLSQVESETKDSDVKLIEFRCILNDNCIKVIDELHQKQYDLFDRLKDVDKNKLQMCSDKVSHYKKKLNKIRIRPNILLFDNSLENELLSFLNKLNRLITYTQHKLRLNVGIDFIPNWNLNVGRLVTRETSLELFEDGYYEGDIENSLMHGVGKLVYFNGSKYEGEFSYHKINGKGTLLKRGVIFCGIWFLDQNKGHGVLWTRNNQICFENWKNQNLDSFFESQINACL